MTTFVVAPARMRRAGAYATVRLDRDRGRVTAARDLADVEPAGGPVAGVLSALDGLLVALRRHWQAPSDLADAVERLDRGHRDLLDRHVAAALDRPRATAGPRDLQPRRRLLAADGPAAVAAAWDDLSPTHQVALVVERPRWIADLDGIPPAVRDRINRARVRDELARLATGTTGPRTPGGGEGVHVRARARRRAAALRALLAADVVLSFDPAGDGRAVVAVGDPTRAAHVATVVPGIGTTLDDAPALVDQVRSLRAAAVATGPAIGHDDVATVAWLGYDAPPGPGEVTADLLGLHAGSAALAATPVVADHHARALVDHVAGVAVHAPDAHQVVVGHSYGSVLALRALRDDHGRAGLDVDAVVALGSPGAGRDLDDPGDLPADVPLWRALAPTDPVRLLPVLGPDPTALGARPLPVGPGNLGHGRYLVAGTVGVAMVAQVVVGRDGCPVPVRDRDRGRGRDRG